MTYEFENPADETIFGYLKNAKTIAIVGMSDKIDRTSYQIAEGLQKNGYQIVPVNPKLAGQKLLNETVYANLAEIPFHIDIVDIFRRSEFLAEVAEDFIQSDSTVFWAQLGLQSEAAEKILCQAGKNDIIMNRCIKIEYNKSGLGKF